MSNVLLPPLSDLGKLTVNISVWALLFHHNCLEQLHLMTCIMKTALRMILAIKQPFAEDTSLELLAFGVYIIAGVQWLHCFSNGISSSFEVGEAASWLVAGSSRVLNTTWMEVQSDTATEKPLMSRSDVRVGIICDIYKTMPVSAASSSGGSRWHRLVYEMNQKQTKYGVSLNFWTST